MKSETINPLTFLTILSSLLLLSLLGGTANGCISKPTPEESPLRTHLSIATQVAETEVKAILAPPPSLPMPEAGKASISGVLYSFTGKGPIPETVFYLTPAIGGENTGPPALLVGPRGESRDTHGLSDAQGRIALNNIPPGNYYLAVWAPYNWILAVESDTNMTPRLIMLKSNQRLNLGIVYVPWP